MKSANRFIVVDDDPLNNLICKHIILKFDQDAQIKLFTQPEKALEAIKETFSVGTDNNGSILLLDINMPVMNGWEFLEVFETFAKKIHQQITIYILSSSIDHGDMEKADQNPYVKGYYQKPLSFDTIRRMLKQINE